MRTDDQAALELRERYAAAAPTIAVDPARIVRQGHRRRTTTRILGAVGVVALVTALGVGLGGLRPDGPAPAPADPPPAESAPVQLWLSATEVPAGAELAAALVSTDPGVPDTFGILATVERWDGQAWQRRGEVAMCPVDWQCSNAVVDRVDAIEEIGLSASPGRPGPLLRMRTDGLEPGWYRISHEGYNGTVAAGAVHVVAGASQPAPLPEIGQSAFTVTPPLVPTTGGVVGMYPVIPADGGGGLTAEDVAMATADLVPEVAVERWTGSDWEPVDVGPVTGSGTAGDPTTSTYVGRLEQGAYRLVRESTGGGLPHTGSFWVVEDRIAGEVEPPPEGGEPTGDEDEGTGTDTQTGSEDDTAGPESPCVENDPVACALGQWLTELIAGAGLVAGGGDHDIASATESVTVDGSTVMLGLIGTARAGDAWAEVEQTGQSTVDTPAGRLQIRSGAYPTGETISSLTCGGFTLSAQGAEVHQRPVLEYLALQLTECPADEDALLITWADFIAGRTG